MKLSFFFIHELKFSFKKKINERIDVCVCCLSYCGRWTHISAYIFMGRFSDDWSRRFRLMLDSMNCCLLVDLVVCRWDWISGCYCSVAACNSKHCPNYGYRCFSDWCCLSFRYAWEAFSLQHPIFGHWENFRDSTAATVTQNAKRQPNKS